MKEDTINPKFSRHSELLDRTSTLSAQHVTHLTIRRNGVFTRNTTLPAPSGAPSPPPSHTNCGPPSLDAAPCLHAPAAVENTRRSIKRWRTASNSPTRQIPPALARSPYTAKPDRAETLWPQAHRGRQEEDGYEEVSEYDGAQGNVYVLVFA